MSKTMESLTIKLPRQLSARVSRLAKKRHLSRSALVREALELLIAEKGGETFVDRASQRADPARSRRYARFRLSRVPTKRPTGDPAADAVTQLPR